MNTDKMEKMEVEQDDAMLSDNDSDIMDEFEESIAAFMEIEKIHTEILEKLTKLSTTDVCDMEVLKGMHATAMEHIRATGTSNFGALLLKQ